MVIDRFIVAHRSRIIERWKSEAESRLSVVIERSQLVDDLPRFVDDLVTAVQSPAGQQPTMDGAHRHGTQRMQIGMDIGGLTEEMMLVGEIILDLAGEEGIDVPGIEVRLLFRHIGRGAAASIKAFAALRDRELASQAADHYSFVAHEIRTPLHTARLTAELLMQDHDQSLASHLTRLKESLTQVSELVDNSISHARLLGQPRLSPQPIRTREIADLVRSDLDEIAAWYQIAITLEVDDLEIEADRKLIYSALSNMLRNGIKFSPTGSEILLRIRAGEDKVIFEVADSCGGIPEEVVPRLFQPFVQENKDKTGFGLGLQIVKQAAEAHNGAVRIANRPGEGCSFILDMPLRYTEA